MTRRLFLLAAVAAAALCAEDFTGKVVAITDGGTSRSCTMAWQGASGYRGSTARNPSRHQVLGRSISLGIWPFVQMVTPKVRGMDRYKRTVAEIVLPDGRT